MRQFLSERNVKKLARKLNLPIVAVSVRGGRDHSKNLHLEDGTIKILLKDGTLIDSKYKSTS